MVDRTGLARFAFALLVLSPPPHFAANAGRSCPSPAELRLPAGFCATLFAASLPAPRHLAVGSDGTVYVALYRSGGGIAMLRDTDGDGVADLRQRVEAGRGHGLAIGGRHLYFAPDDVVLRYELGQLPGGQPDTIVRRLSGSPVHGSKSLVVRGSELLVSIGAPSNACHDRIPKWTLRWVLWKLDRLLGEDRLAPGGLDPCPELQRRAGIWRFDRDRIGQTQADGDRFATGVRNAVATAIDPRDGELYAAVHGRDQLALLWPERFDPADEARLPGEEITRIEEGADLGWPYCFHNAALGRKVLNPEYGGDGFAVGRCAGVQPALVSLPPHSAPNALLFHDGSGLPPEFGPGALLALHGSHHEAARDAGYRVVFLAIAGPGAPAAAPRDFVTAGKAHDGPFRPTGLALDTDGALLISDDHNNRIWRVVYSGSADHRFGSAGVEQR